MSFAQKIGRSLLLSLIVIGMLFLVAIISSLPLVILFDGWPNPTDDLGSAGIILSFLSYALAVIPVAILLRLLVDNKLSPSIRWRGIIFKPFWLLMLGFILCTVLVNLISYLLIQLFGLGTEASETQYQLVFGGLSSEHIQLIHIVSAFGYLAVLVPIVEEMLFRGFSNVAGLEKETVRPNAGGRAFSF